MFDGHKVLPTAVALVFSYLFTASKKKQQKTAYYIHRTIIVKHNNCDAHILCLYPTRPFSGSISLNFLYNLKIEINPFAQTHSIMITQHKTYAILTVRLDLIEITFVRSLTTTSRWITVNCTPSTIDRSHASHTTRALRVHPMSISIKWMHPSRIWHIYAALAYHRTVFVKIWQQKRRFSHFAALPQTNKE